MGVMNFAPLATLTGQTLLITPRRAGQLLRFGGVELPADPEEPIRVQGTGLVEVSSGWWDELAIVDGDYPGPYFDGDTADLELVQYEWTATPHASPSTWQARDVDVPTHVVWEADPGRVFDLGLRSRVVDHAAKIVTVRLASDEALLIDYATLVSDATPQDYQDSLRAIVNYVLGLAVPGAVLEPGPDVPMTTYFTATNIIGNGGVRTDAAGWVYQNGAAGTGPAGRIPVSIGGQPNITATASVTGLAAASGSPAVGLFYNGGVNPGPLQVNVTPGQHIYGTCWVQLNVATTVSLNFQFTTVAVVGPPVAIPANTWTRLDFDTIVPADQTTLGPFVYTRAATPAGVNFLVAGLTVLAGARPDGFFDGAAVDTPAYLYAWDGIPNQSTSTRTALIERPPEMLVWGPGVPAWEFLAPLLSQPGFRLFCDELRKWRMVVPADYRLPGIVTGSPGNATAGTDTISRDDAEVFATGVLVHYRWIDPATAEVREAWDDAGTPEKVLIVEYPLPYPGPGAASAILARRDGTGRSQDVTVLAEWNTSPGMEASISLPYAPLQKGKVSAVQFSLGDDSVMTLGTRDLIDIPHGSIDLLVGTIDALAGTIDTQYPEKGL